MVEIIWVNELIGDEFELKLERESLIEKKLDVWNKFQNLY
jgi:hypothetical protein